MGLTVRSRFGAGVFDLVRRAAFKTVIGPLRYRRGEGYDSERYWRDRFARYGTTPGRASGIEGLSEDQNRAEYETATRIVLDAAEGAGVDLKTARVLDVGCGPGFFTEAFAARGVSDYTGVDITDHLFGELRERFPDYRFVRADATEDTLEGEYDLVILIDVAFHIVETERFDRCVENLARVLAPGGILLVGAMVAQQRRELFYVRFWSVDDLRSRLEHLVELERVPYRVGYLQRFRKPAADD